MATKKTSKSSKTKTTNKPIRQSKAAPVDHNHIGLCFVTMGVLMACLLFGLFYYMGRAMSSEKANYHCSQEKEEQSTQE